jgi:hypothetical protein
MDDRQLSPNFKLSEFLVSQTAARQGIRNVPGDAEIANLEQLCRQVLEPVRAVLRQPMFISSGFRCPELNKAVGGAVNSDHIYGRAADFTSPNAGSVADIWGLLRGKADLPFYQLIREFDQAGHGWVHISWRKPDPKPVRQVLIIDTSGTQVV